MRFAYISKYHSLGAPTSIVKSRSLNKNNNEDMLLQALKHQTGLIERQCGLPSRSACGFARLKVVSVAVATAANGPAGQAALVAVAFQKSNQMANQISLVIWLLLLLVVFAPSV